MPKKIKRDVRIQRADMRRRMHPPSPEVAEITAHLRKQLTPATFAKAREGHTHLKLRDRILNLPVMCAIVLSMVSRQFPSLSVVLRELELKGLLWVESTTVSKEALSKRLTRMPSELFASLFGELLRSSAAQSTSKKVPSLIEAEFGHLRAHYSCIWIADGSTLERLRKTTKELQEVKGSPLAGKILLLIDALTRRPLEVFYNPEAKANEKTFIDQILAALPKGGLLIFDSGFTNYGFYATLSDRASYFITRIRTTARYDVLRTLSSSSHYRDEVISLGDPRYRTDHEYRLISVLWGKTWHRYLTNECDPERLKAREVAQLYRTRWRIEEAFALTKRLLGLSYLWIGGTNGVEIQLWSTLIFYTAVMDLCEDVAAQLGQPVERLSVEMVFRSLYHYDDMQQSNSELTLVGFLVKHAKTLGIVKEQKKRDRLRDKQLNEIWGSTVS